MTNRSALLISCSKEEARTIREHARLQRRTISGYVFNIVMRAIEFEDKMAHVAFGRLTGIVPKSQRGAKTTMLLWCAKEESERIRGAAKRRGATISGFILHTLRRSWRVAGENPNPPRELLE